MPNLSERGWFFQFGFLIRCPLSSLLASFFIICISTGDSVRTQVYLGSSQWTGQSRDTSSPSFLNGLNCCCKASFFLYCACLHSFRKNQCKTETNIMSLCQGFSNCFCLTWSVFIFSYRFIMSLKSFSDSTAPTQEKIFAVLWWVLFLKSITFAFVSFDAQKDLEMCLLSMKITVKIESIKY